jgi:hypothetical protein
MIRLQSKVYRLPRHLYCIRQVTGMCQYNACAPDISSSKPSLPCACATSCAIVFWSLSGRQSGTELQKTRTLLTWAHSGHQPPSFTSPGLACHWCPAAHRHLSFVPLLIYRSERHSPPRIRARAFISASVRGFLCAHSGHQLPFLIFVGIARHSWPSLHLQCRWVRESTYRREMHRPPRRLASLRISERVALRMTAVTGRRAPRDQQR